MTIPSDPELLIPVLLQPVSPDQPCGVPLRHEPEYHRIQEARRQDDPDLPLGIWQADVKSADWRQVEQLCCEALQLRSKDLMVVAWLGEAWIHRYGLAGWIKGFELQTAVCERYWAELHPQAVDGDESWRTAPLEWMLRTFAEALRFRVPLFGDAPDATLGAYQGWQRQSVSGGDRHPDKDAAALAAKAIERFHGMVRAGSPARLRSLSQDLAGARQTLGVLEALCDGRMRDDAPSFGGVQRVLDECVAMLNGLEGVLPWKVAAVPEEKCVSQHNPISCHKLRRRQN